MILYMHSFFFSKSYSSLHIKTEAKINKTNIVLPKIIPLFRVITFHCGSFCLILSKNLRFGFNLLRRLIKLYKLQQQMNKNQSNLFLAEK